MEDAKLNQIPVFLLNPEDLDSRGDIEFPFSEGDVQKRGGMEYKQPSSEWVRVGLKVKGNPKYVNDDWLSMDGRPGEWAVGFHGSKTEKSNVGIAETREIRPGGSNVYWYDEDINELSDNKGDYCGRGSYFADDINISASSMYSTKIKGRICVFQARLCPSKVRIPVGKPAYRIVNEAQYARPYGICVKFTDDKKNQKKNQSTEIVAEKWIRSEWKRVIYANS